MKKYYYLDENVQHGPVSLEELKEVNLTRQTLVWYEGVADWTKAESLTDLKPLFVTTPPPPPISQQSKTKSEQFEQKKPKSNILLAFVIGAFVLIGLIYLVQNIKSSAANQAVQTVEDNTQANESLAKERKANRQELVNQLNQVKEELTAEQGTFGGYSNVMLTLKNPSKLRFDFVKVQIRYYKANGGAYQDDVLIFYDVAPYSEQTLQAPDSNRGTSYVTQIFSYKSPDLPKSLQRNR